MFLQVTEYAAWVWGVGELLSSHSLVEENNGNVVTASC